MDYSPSSILLYSHWLLSFLTSFTQLLISRLLPTLKVPPTNASTKIALITGANSGIGLSLATSLALRGASVVLLVRTPSKGHEAAQKIKDIVKESNGADAKVVVVKCDVSSFQSIEQCVREVREVTGMIKPGARDDEKVVDLMYHNAGVPGGEGFTEDGFDVMYQSNFLGSFYLTYLLETGKAGRHSKGSSPASTTKSDGQHGMLARDARVIFTSSFGQYAGALSSSFELEKVTGRREEGWHYPVGVGRVAGQTSGTGRYAMTKLMQCTLARALQTKWDREGRSSSSSSSSSSLIQTKGVSAGDTASTGNRRVACSFSPGYSTTGIFGKVSEIRFTDDPVFWFLREATRVAVSEEQGAATGLWLGTVPAEQIGRGKGGFWDRQVCKTSSADLLSEQVVEMMWMRWCRDCEIDWDY